MGDRFEELRTFIAVSEAGGFAAAARRLSLATSAVSRRVRELEIRLGTQLIRRNTRHLQLTDAGRLLHERSLRVLLDLEDAEDEVASGEASITGRLRVTAPVSFTTHCLAPVLSEFLDAHPRVTLEIDTDDRIVDIIGEGYDLAIRISKLRDSGLAARRIATIRHVCCASPALLDRLGRPHVPEDLSSLPGIRYGNVEEGQYWKFAGGRSPAVQSRLALMNGEAIREAAIAGVGVAMLPTFIAHEAIRRGALEVILADHMRAPIAIHAVYPASRNPSRRQRAFIDFLVDHFASDPHWDRDLLW
jgi:DNA-binding transcriptional LysR family regulator